ncbi:MAG: hypothetical protein PHD73_05990 [Sediminibacterium sp.]|nr:hypothetical protein [Sediminibacterium sp.]
MKYFIVLLIALSCTSQQAHSQGCVAIRGAGGASCGPLNLMNHIDTTGLFFSANTRYFKSFRHFVGTDEQKHRVAQGTEVINHTFTMDLGITKIINKRWSMTVYVPIISNSRSSLYEHGGAARHETHSFGLGDIRLAGYVWVTNPSKFRRFNLQAGLGIKLATGDYRYTDRFYTNTGTRVVGPVDQSIQLGDGGTGVTAELNLYHRLSPRTGLYGNFYYLINPREQNGVSTARGGTPAATAVAYTTDVMSVPDQYLIRGGMNYHLGNWTVSGGLRFECIPAKDLFGGSEGFRRPGEVLTIEPGVTYMFRKINLYAYVPVAVMRNRTQSVPDQIRTNLTGVYAKGDAAFADYSVNIGLSMRLH